jgi:hypothetical protein
MEGLKQQKTDMKSGTSNFRCPGMPSLLKTMATELAKNKIDFVVLQEVRFKKVGNEWAVDFIFVLKREMSRV